MGPPSGGALTPSTPILQEFVEGHQLYRPVRYCPRNVQACMAMERRTLLQVSQTRCPRFPPNIYYYYYYYYYYYFKPSKNEGRKKIEKVKMNGEANVPSGRPTQNYCATKQN